MIPELKSYLNRPQIKKLIKEEQYTQVLYHMELDSAYNLMPYYIDLLFECGADLTKLNYSGLVEELQDLFDKELNAKVVLALATNFNYESTWNEASLIYAFIYNNKCYSGEVDILYNAKYDGDWPCIFEDCHKMIFRDVDARIRDGDCVIKLN